MIFFLFPFLSFSPFSSAFSLCLFFFQLEIYVFMNCCIILIPLALLNLEDYAQFYTGNLGPGWTTLRHASNFKVSKKNKKFHKPNFKGFLSAKSIQNSLLWSCTTSLIQILYSRESLRGDSDNGLYQRHWSNI